MAATSTTAAYFGRWDTWFDTWQQLATPPIAPITWASMRFSGAYGHEGLVLSCPANNQMQIPAYWGKALKGYDVRIICGTGAGQRRVITDVADPVVHEIGMPTGVNNVLGALTMTDSTKAWTFNQWRGYQVRMGFGAGERQVRKILSNTATVLTLGDSTVMAHEFFANPAITSPAMVVVGTGVGTVYQIESSVVTVDDDWATNPDATSYFRVMSGVINLFSSAATTPFYTNQWYDVVTDTWYIKTAPTLNIAAVGTDGTIERTTENASTWDRGKATSGSGTTLVDTTVPPWTTDQWIGYNVFIFSGAGEGRMEPITDNTTDTLTFANGTAIDSTSRYVIAGYDAGVCTTGGASTLQDTDKTWAVNRWAGYAVRIVYGTGKGQIVQIASNTADTLTTIKPWVATAGYVQVDNTSVYEIQADPDKIYLAMGANAATLIHNIYDDVPSFGKRIDGGLASIAHVHYGWCRPVAIASVSHATTTATITTAFPHMLKVGWVVTVAGMTSAEFNGAQTILTVPSATTFTYTMAGDPANNTIAGSHSQTQLFDTSKNWASNEHVGRICYMTSSAVTAASGLATGQAMQISGNGSNYLTFPGNATAAPTNGVTRYVITNRRCIGEMENGIATGTQSTSTLQDTTHNTTFTGSITGTTMTITVATNKTMFPGHAVTGAGVTAGTVVMAQITSTESGSIPNGTGTYLVSMSHAATGSITITNGWVVNVFAGRKVHMLGATGQNLEYTINSNTINTLTFTAGTAPVTLMTPYTILAPAVRGAGIEMNWAYNPTRAADKGRYLWVPRGGGVVGWDRIDLGTDQIIIASASPQVDTLGASSYYAYDGEDRIYFQKDFGQLLYYYDLATDRVEGAGKYPYAVGTTAIGNRMEVYETIDRVKILWLNRHIQTDCYRMVIPF
jgi:hypothetical protein